MARIRFVPARNARSASGLFSMMRNLGGAVGIAVPQTLLTKREPSHYLDPTKENDHETANEFLSGRPRTLSRH